MKLLGAIAKNGCLFITMPEHSKFGSLSDRDAERIFKYLVGLARYLGIVFNFFRKGQSLLTVFHESPILKGRLAVGVTKNV